MTARTYGRVITVMGSPSVGKTALVIRLVHNRFNDEYLPTIAGTHYRDMEHNGNLYKLTIYDTAGVEPYSAIPGSYITNTNGYVLVYSITDRESFETIQNIYSRLVEANNRSIPIVLVGNKSDLNNDRRVETYEGEQLARKWHAPFIETSAKVGDRVRDIFLSCLNTIDSTNTSSTQPRDRPQEQKTPEEKKSGNCQIF